MLPPDAADNVQSSASDQVVFFLSQEAAQTNLLHDDLAGTIILQGRHQGAFEPVQKILEYEANEEGDRTNAKAEFSNLDLFGVQCIRGTPQTMPISDPRAVGITISTVVANHPSRKVSALRARYRLSKRDTEAPSKARPPGKR
ncbi:MAG: hypothetical protein ING28_20035 [Roseomonas sp.]|nr:hypothetical protein [Roseomonas sp.]